MKVEGRLYRTIWLGEDARSVEVIDQTRLPHEFVVKRLATLADAAEVWYQMSAPYAPESADGLRWNDPRLGIEWPDPPAGGRPSTASPDAGCPCAACARSAP